MPSKQSAATQKHSWTFEAFGVPWEVTTYAALPVSLKDKITTSISGFNDAYSRFKSDSTVRRMATSPGVYTLPRHSETLLDFYDELYELTDGAVTPLVGGQLEDLGYDQEYTFSPKEKVRHTPALTELPRRHTQMTIKEPVVFDVGAAGKGFMIDTTAALLERGGVHDALIDASGDIRCLGRFKEKIGLEHPTDTSLAIGAVMLDTQSLAASATGRRHWGGVHHIINPHSGSPASDVIATWVIADSAMIADGLATALFFVSPEQLRSRYTYEYLVLYPNGSADCSPVFKEALFS